MLVVGCWWYIVDYWLMIVFVGCLLLVDRVLIIGCCMLFVCLGCWLYGVWCLAVAALLLVVCWLLFVACGVLCVACCALCCVICVLVVVSCAFFVVCGLTPVDFCVCSLLVVVCRLLLLV